MSERLSREQMAARLAQDIPEGAYVNLGIGLPTAVSNHLPPEREIILHTENGMLGMGPIAEEDEIDSDLINAGKIPVTQLPGAAYFDHAESFAMIRGRHLDLCVLGAFQVSVAGDLANWHTGAADAIPAIGGAMDLAIGAKAVYVIMNLFARDGTCKLIESCTYPLTGTRCVDVVYTDYAIFRITPAGVEVAETFGTASVESLRAMTGLELHAPATVGA